MCDKIKKINFADLKRTCGYNLIKSYQDYLFYLKADARLRPECPKTFFEKIKSKIQKDSVWDFQRLMRKAEYYSNCRKDFVGKLYTSYLRYKFFKAQEKLGFDIMGLNIFGPGLIIGHRGSLVVHPGVKVGANCMIASCVTIGAQRLSDAKVPIIGDNVGIGSGARIIGGITIADNIQIGANAVVNKTFLEKGISIGGVPAKKISDKGTEAFSRGIENDSV